MVSHLFASEAAKELPLSWKIPPLKRILPGFILVVLTWIPALNAESKIQSGLLFLDEPEKSYHLTGTWLHWKDKNRDEAPNPLSSDWKPIQVPGLWRNLGIIHDGSIYYKLDFRLGHLLQGNDLGLIVPNTAFAYEVYLNGKKLHSIGKIKKDGRVEERSTESSFVLLPKNYLLPKGKNTIMIRVGSYGTVGGFNLGNIFLGKKEVIQEKFLRSLLWDTIITAIFIFVGVYHLVIYSARRKDKDYLYYSLMCFAIAMYNLTFTTLSYWLWDNFYFYYFGVVLSVNSLPIFLVQFFHKFFEVRKRFIGKSIIVVSMFLMGIGLFLNLSGEENFLRFNSFVLKILLSVVAFSLVYPVYYIWIGIKKERIGRYLVLLGYILFVTSVINDILIYLNYYNFYKFVELGFFAFIVCISFAMALKFAQVHTDLEYLTDNLKEEVSKRTRELTESNKRLIELDRIKTSFFANVTHELRTPITLSLLPIEGLIQKTTNNHDLTLLETAHRNNIKLLKLINDLLDYAKLEAGVMSLRLVPTNISRLLEGLLSPFEINAKERGIDLTKEIIPDIHLTIDPEKMEKVLTNLLSNAYKFTKDSGKIWVRTKIVHLDKEYFQITVGDNGVGIPEDEIDHIFERFRQVDMSTQRKFEGTGIGLSLVKELTELHGGYVDVESEPDVKTEFNLFIPIQSTRIENDNNESTESSLPNFSKEVIRTFASNMPALAEINSDHSPKILLVEDNREMLYLLQDLLRDEYSLYFSQNAREGLEKAIDIRPDLILSDVMMPGMNGFQFAKAIRDSPPIKHTPIVLLTAMNDLDGKLEGFTHGVDDYISKPFQPEELKARIQNLIQKSNLQKEKNQRLNQLQRELILARDIQSMLLPTKLPELKEFSMEAMYIPLDEVGGDFYDIYLERENLTIFMADVSGHGVPACLIACMVKMAFQSEVRDKKNQNVSEIMKGINRSLYKIIGNNFVTASLARINLETKHVYYVTAGHPPFFHIAKGIAHPQMTKGKPLGVFDDIDFPIGSLDLKAKDSLFFYTDGIIESSNQWKEFYEEERLVHFLQRHSNLEPLDVLDGLTQELKGFVGGNLFEDDVTAVHIKFTV